ncbi:hypothetical protein ACFWJS_33865 [Streptomyces sp. NPDC127061]|uniref:hypothetical protein n=1 Tax=Streptomyces sp. NPDC127061 TaxID=3347122 RepID=UPI0036529B0D
MVQIEDTAGDRVQVVRSQRNTVMAVFHAGTRRMVMDYTPEQARELAAALTTVADEVDHQAWDNADEGTRMGLVCEEWRRATERLRQPGRTEGKA